MLFALIWLFIHLFIYFTQYYVANTILAIFILNYSLFTLMIKCIVIGNIKINMRQSYLNNESTLKRMLYFTMIDVEFLDSLSDCIFLHERWNVYRLLNPPVNMRTRQNNWILFLLKNFVFVIALSLHIHYGRFLPYQIKWK